jgi:hypothetical protein
VKIVDRLPSNDGIDFKCIAPAWVRWVVGHRKEIAVALDWTEYDSDDGRATPLLWKAARKSALKVVNRLT